MEKKRIYLVEHDIQRKKKLIDLFQDDDYDVQQFDDSLLSIDHTNNSQTSFIVIDLLMQNRESSTIFNKIISEHKNNKIPVIVLTTLTNETKNLELIKKHVLDYIYHPFSKEEILFRLKNNFDYCLTGEKQIFFENLLFNKIKELFLIDKKQWLEPQRVKNTPFGYIYPDIPHIFNHVVQYRLHEILEKWAELKLIENCLVDITEVCPVCNYKDIYYTNICPMCESAQLIDHLTNDRMQSLFKCTNCQKLIRVPRIKCQCLNCNETFMNEKLVRHKIYKYKLISNQLFEENLHNSNLTKDKINIDKEEDHCQTNNSSLWNISDPSKTLKQKIKKNYFLTAIKDSKITYTSYSNFKQQLLDKIDLAKILQFEVTVMSLSIENFDQLIMKLDTQVLFEVFQSIVLIIKKHLRPSDIFSFDEKAQKILVMLPETHLNIAKIIADRVQHKVDYYTTTFPLEIKFASFPQDGKDADEVLTMMEIGIEKVDSEVFA